MKNTHSNDFLGNIFANRQSETTSRFSQKIQEKTTQSFADLFAKNATPNYYNLLSRPESHEVFSWPNYGSVPEGYQNQLLETIKKYVILEQGIERLEIFYKKIEKENFDLKKRMTKAKIFGNISEEELQNMEKEYGMKLQQLADIDAVLMKLHQKTK